MMIPQLIEETQSSLLVDFYILFDDWIFESVFECCGTKKGGNKPLRWAKKEESNLFERSGFVGRVLLEMMRSILMLRMRWWLTKSSRFWRLKLVKPWKSSDILIFFFQGKGWNAEEGDWLLFGNSGVYYRNLSSLPLNLRSVLVQCLCLCSVFRLALPTNRFLTYIIAQHFSVHFEYCRFICRDLFLS